MSSRREFLKTTAAAGGALLAGSAPNVARAATLLSSTQAEKPLSILILGGTGFIGPHLVKHAVERGHTVTIFTRGRHDADLPDSVIRLQGDRDGQLGALAGKTWDAVVDDSATNPEWVRQSTELLKSSGRYLFTSSTGVFYPYLKRGADESWPVLYEAADPKDGSLKFGTDKASCERLVMKAFGDRGLVVRPSFIVGPGDTTDRFPYWPVRLARGGEVLAPGKRDDPVQFVDVRDLAEFIVRLLEGKRSGAYNVAGPKTALMAYDFYRAAAQAIKADVKFTFVDDYEFLAEHKIGSAIPWAMLRGNNDGLMSVKNGRAVAAGLTFRPLEITMRDTLAWWPSVPVERRDAPKFTIKPDQEAKALAAWHARQGK